MQRFSVSAPQQPRNGINDRTNPVTIKTIETVEKSPARI